MAPDTTVLVRLYTRRWCFYCLAARRFFRRFGVEFEETRLDGRPQLRREISEQAGNWPTVPMIFVGDIFIGGYREATSLHRRGELLGMCFPD